MQSSTPRLRNRAIAAASAIAITAVLSACTQPTPTPSGEDATITLGFSPMNQQAPALIGLGQGVTGYATGNGVSEVLIADPNNDAATQASQIKAWVENGQVQGFWSLAVSASALSDVLKTAQEKGVVAVVNGVPSDYGFDGLQPGITFSVIDYEAVGTQMGEAMSQCLSERGSGSDGIINVQLPAGQVGSDEEQAGFAAALADGSPDAAIVATLQGQGDVASSQAAVSSALQANPNAIGIYSFNDEDAAGAINAVTATGKNPADYCIVTLGGSEQSAAAVEAGTMYALTAFQFEADLAQTVDELIAMTKDPKAMGKQLTTPIKTSITTAN